MKLTDKITAYNADCMEIMAQYEDNYFDLAVVDPPYKSETAGLKSGINRGDFNYKALSFPPTKEYIKELFRISSNQVLWGFNYYLELLPNTDAVIFWHKHQNGHFSEGETAWVSCGKTRFFDRAYQKDIGGKIHPTQKPVKLYDWIFHNYAKPEFKIIDTHGGSFSSAISAHYFGCEMVICELDKDYFNDSVSRFKRETAQLKMF